MKKHLYLIVISIAFTACQPSKEDICNKLDAGIRTYLEDNAFKENAEIQIFDLKTVDYKMVGERALDTMRSNYFLTMASRYFDAGVSKRKSIQARLDLYKSYNSLGMDKPTGWKEEMEDDVKRMGELQDSSTYFRGQDSLTQNRIDIRKGFEPVYYRTTTYLKATMDKENILDTLHLLLNTDFKVMSAKP